jgi:hypothetical protein
MGKIIELHTGRELTDPPTNRVRLTAPAADMLSALVADAHHKIALAYGCNEITIEDLQGLARIFDVEIVEAK